MAIQGRDPMKGRTGVSVQRVTTGKQRKGQSEPASNKFKTATNQEVSRKPPMVPNAKDTSADAMRMIKESPDPFKNRMQTPQMPAPSAARGAKPGGESVANPRGVYAGKAGKQIGQSNPSGAAIGQSTMPNQSKQIGGRMGFPPPAKKAGNNLSRFPQKRGNAFYGDN